MAGTAYQIWFQSTFIGTSYLEGGDPPMACAEGVLHITEAYQAARSQFEIVEHRDGIVIYSGFHATTADGTRIMCSGIKITDFQRRNASTFLPDVDVIGISDTTYERLFPEHTARYFGEET